MTPKQLDIFIPIAGCVAGALLFWAVSQFFAWQSRRRFGPRGRPTKPADHRLF